MLEKDRKSMIYLRDKMASEDFGISFESLSQFNKIEIERRILAKIQEIEDKDKISLLSLTEMINDYSREKFLNKKDNDILSDLIGYGIRKGKINYDI